MKFSIIVPIYKTEQYLRKCVDTLIKQTYKDIEIILVDDESPDAASQMCDEYAHFDTRIKVIHKKNSGLSDARNAGLAIATGDYVIFVDSDDYVEYDMCAKMLTYTAQEPDIIIGDAIVEGGKSHLSHIENVSDLFTGEEYLKKAYAAGKAPMAAWLNIYKRDFLSNNNLQFKYGILHEDEEFTPRAFLAAQSVVCTGVLFYHYIIREGSITTKKDKRKNATDLYNTCTELEKVYLKLADIELRKYLLNSLADKFLGMFQVAKLFQYGDEYIKKEFVVRNAKLSRTRKKAKLYALSPRLYYYTNKIAKLISG